MAHEPIRVLIVGDPERAGLQWLALALVSAPSCTLTTVLSLEEAWPLLENDEADVLVSCEDLGHDGLDAVAALRTRAPRVAVVLVSGETDDRVGVQAVRAGAQDWLVREALDARILRRALRFSVERQKNLLEFRDMSLIDHLTKLYNRRGLSAVVGKQLEMAERLECRAFVLFADLDDLKQVNDGYGHAAGDTYIQLAAEAIKQSFRAADVVARVGGDEFVVLGLETTPFDPMILITRVEKNLQRLAKECALPHRVAVSCGVERFDPRQVSVDAALQIADTAMYATKRARKEMTAT
jgi:diguanylate cyclase (GGDEF)-like protein